MATNPKPFPKADRYSGLVVNCIFKSLRLMFRNCAKHLKKSYCHENCKNYWELNMIKSSTYKSPYFWGVTVVSTETPSAHLYFAFNEVLQQFIVIWQNFPNKETFASRCLFSVYFVFDKFVRLAANLLSRANQLHRTLILTT
jgi:hypothetical protein